MKATLITAAAFGAMLLGSVQAMAVPITSAGTLTSGSYSFSNFGCSVSTGGAASPGACSQINVALNPAGSGGTASNPDLQFTSNFNALAIGITSFADATVGYTVTNSSGINSIGLDFNGTFLGLAIAQVTETVKNAAGTVVGQLSVSCSALGCDLQDAPYEAGDIPLSGTYTTLYITKDISVFASVAGNANISVIDQTYRSAVPEPASLALVGLGLAAVGFIRRRRTGQVSV